MYVVEMEKDWAILEAWKTGGQGMLAPLQIFRYLDTQIYLDMTSSSSSSSD